MLVDRYKFAIDSMARLRLRLQCVSVIRAFWPSLGSPSRPPRQSVIAHPGSGHVSAPARVIRGVVWESGNGMEVGRVCKSGGNGWWWLICCLQYSSGQSGKWGVKAGNSSMGGGGEK